LCFCSEEIKNLIIKIVAEAKEASLKRRKLNVIDEDHEESETVEGGQGCLVLKENKLPLLVSGESKQL